MTASLAKLLHALGALTTWRATLTFISSVTTLRGMMLLYDVFGGGHGGSLGYLAYLIPFGLAGSLHAAIYWALGRWASLGRRKYLLLAVPLQALAVIASYGTHWTGMRGESVTIEGFENSQSGVVRALQEFDRSDEFVATSMASLAQHSEEQAKIEATRGGSCGVNAGVGQGPRFRLRMDDRANFSEFNKRVGERRSQIRALVERGEQITASSADEALANRTELRRIVDAAKSFENDPLVSQLKSAVEQRLLEGRSAIPIPPAQRSKSEAQSFACPDPTLDANLSAVLAAIAALKPVPEVEFEDAREARVGFALALKRMVTSLFGMKVLPATRPELVAARTAALSPAPEAADALVSEDIPPMVVAIVIEAGLTLLFAIGGGTLPIHPGLGELEELVKRERRRVFDAVWIAFGGNEKRGAARAAISRFTKFEGKSALVIVPIYSERPEVRLVHDLMCILAPVHLAKCVYTGRFLAPLFGLGWTRARRVDALCEGPVRVYRMTAVDYLALLLDALCGDSRPQSEASGAGKPASATKLLSHSERERAAA
jgi:hypothetical protein